MGGGGRGDGGKLVLAIVVAIGLLVALRWIYIKVQEYAATVARRTQDVVLDYRERGAKQHDTDVAFPM
eukprot:COSAG05_NODE_141_length_16655_cov_22.580963_9_plen_68_part_00